MARKPGRPAEGTLVEIRHKDRYLEFVETIARDHTKNNNRNEAHRRLGMLAQVVWERLGSEEAMRLINEWEQSPDNVGQLTFPAA